MSLLEIQLTEQVWNSLKIAIIIIAALAPFVIVILVFRYNRIIKRLEKKHETDQKIVEKRIEIYDRIGPKLNEILSFYCYIGNWKEITPMDVIRLKRELDKEINTYAPLFSDDISKKYSEFIQLCFISFSGWEHEEKIKSLYELRQENNVEWNDDWIAFFDTKNVIDAIKMKERYNELMGVFKKDLSL
jgi:hypothetical protein